MVYVSGIQYSSTYVEVLYTILLIVYRSTTSSIHEVQYVYNTTVDTISDESFVTEHYIKELLYTALLPLL